MAGPDELGKGERGACYDVSEVGLPNEAVFGGEFVDELRLLFWSQSCLSVYSQDVSDLNVPGQQHHTVNLLSRNNDEVEPSSWMFNRDFEREKDVAVCDLK